MMADLEDQDNQALKVRRDQSVSKESKAQWDLTESVVSQEKLALRENRWAAATVSLRQECILLHLQHMGMHFFSLE